MSSAEDVLPLLGATIEGTESKLSFEPDQNGTGIVKVNANGDRFSGVANLGTADDAVGRCKGNSADPVST